MSTDVDKLVLKIEQTIDDFERMALAAYVEHSELKRKKRELLSLIHDLRREVNAKVKKGQIKKVS